MPAPFASTLKPRQQAILDFLAAFAEQHGYPASFRDVQDHFGFKSANGVLCHLKALERKGVIDRDRVVSRGIRLVGDKSVRPRVEKVGERVTLRLGNAIAELTQAEVLTLARQLCDVATRPLAG